TRPISASSSASGTPSSSCAQADAPLLPGEGRDKSALARMLAGFRRCALGNVDGITYACGKQRDEHGGRQARDGCMVDLANELPARRHLDEDKAGRRIDKNREV